MSDYDQDLITDLISGRLSPEEQQVALTRVTSDPELRTEYARQLATVSLLNEAPAPAMTPDERSALRAALMEQLHLDHAAAAAPVAPSRRQRWWAPATGLAVAAAVIVGAIIILPGSGSDDAMEFAAAAVTTTAATEQGAPTEGSDEQDQSAFSGTTDDNDVVAAPETTTTAAASGEGAPATAEDATSTAPAAAELEARALPHLPDLDIERLALAYASGQDEFEETLAKSTVELGLLDAAAAYDCYEASDGAPTGAATVAVVASGTLDGAEVAVLVVTSSDAESYLVAIDMDSCLLVSSTQR